MNYYTDLNNLSPFKECWFEVNFKYIILMFGFYFYSINYNKMI